MGFAEKMDAIFIKMRVYDRAAVKALACGTDACATMVFKGTIIDG